jgi:hypothetical protein
MKLIEGFDSNYKVKWEIPETRTAAEQAEDALDRALGQD